MQIETALKGRQIERQTSSDLPPFQGLALIRHLNPGLTPWAALPKND
jgi:hypothetical protein